PLEFTFIVFLCICGRLPNATLFPYTTLFRSTARRRSSPWKIRGPRTGGRRARATRSRGTARRTTAARAGRPGRALRPASSEAARDRKSTRLELQSRGHLVCRQLLEKKKDALD